MSKISDKFKGTYFISSISITSAICEFGISSIFTLFLLYVLHFSIPLTSKTYAYYYGFAYILPILIGYISDKYLKKTTSLIMGFVSMIISQLILSFASSLYTPSEITYNTIFFNVQNISFFIGLLFLALGLSFTNLSFSHIINSINKEHEHFKAFSIFYPILNIGVMLGSIIMSITVGEENFHIYKWAFLIFAAILTMGLITFLMLKNRYLVDNEGNQMEDEKDKDSIKKEIASLYKKITSRSLDDIKNLSITEKRKIFNNSLNQHQKDRIKVFVVFLFIIVLYRIAYTQSNISMVFFIDSFVDRNLDFYEIPVQLFFILNPLFILILGPLYIKFNNYLENKKIELDFINRTTIALLIITLSFIFLSSIAWFIDLGHVNIINPSVIIIFELMIAISELFFSIAGYSMVGDLSPEKYYSLFFGLFLATRAVAMYICGIISSTFPVESASKYYMYMPLDGIMAYFLIFVAITLIATIIIVVLRKKLKAKMHLEDFEKNETH